MSSTLAVSTLTARPVLSASTRHGSLIIVRRVNIVLSHRVIGKLLPHQNTAQIGMPLEDNPVKVKNLTLLKLRAAPHRSQRRKLRLIRAIGGSQPQNHRPMLLLHRKKVIHRFQMARSPRLSDLLDLRSTPSTSFFVFTFSLTSASSQSTPVTFEQ